MGARGFFFPPIFIFIFPLVVISGFLPLTAFSSKSRNLAWGWEGGAACLHGGVLEKCVCACGDGEQTLRAWDLGLGNGQCFAKPAVRCLL